LTEQVLERAPQARRSSVPVARISTRRVHTAIAVIIAIVVAGAAWTLVADLHLGLGQTLTGRASRRMFNLRKEGGLAAALSFLLLLGAAGALWLATWASDDDSPMARYRPRWRLLTLALVAVAFDEAFAFHERLNGPLREAFGLSGVFTFAWVIPYSFAAIALAMAMIGPLRALPSRTLRFMLAGGACYVLGAVGMELLGGHLMSVGVPKYVYEAEVFVEELLEMVGLWLFTAGALTLVRGRDLRLSIR
jgi:hypothetical protein